jgi:hypothetical protein
MAYIRDEYCHRCEKETQHCNHKCTNCAEREYRERTAAWNALTTDEKLQDIRKRLEDLERGPAQYA